MFLVGLLSWWYGDGFFARILSVKNRLASTSDFFSIFVLVKTLFAPYKQISAGQNIDSSETKLQIFTDKMISRLIGFLARTLLITAGCIVMIIQVIFGLLVMIFWVVLPFVPVVGLIMYVIGWAPEW